MASANNFVVKNGITVGNSNVFTVSASSGVVSIGNGGSIASVSLALGTSDAILLPSGNTAQRPNPYPGMIRYNSTSNQFEGYTTSWGSLAGSGVASNIAGGLSNQIVYQTAGNTTSFITAPSSPNTVLSWANNTFTWVAANTVGGGGGGGSSSQALSLALSMTFGF